MGWVCSLLSIDAFLPPRARGVRRAVRSVVVLVMVVSSVSLQHAWAMPEAPVRSSSPWVEHARRLIHQFLFHKTIAIEGVGASEEESILSALPASRSVLWWFLNRSSIAAQLAMLPRVESASVTSCADEWDLRCFVVHVQERKPVFVTIVGDHGWLVGKDGGLVKPLPNVRTVSDVEAFREVSEEPLVAVDGVESPESGLEVVRGRLRYVADVIATIESELPMKIQSVSLERNGEARVSFQGKPYPVLFGFADSDLSSLAEEARRFNLLLSRLEGREELIREIDLAFQKVAVVRLKDAAPQK
jgi:hypothetical protein